KIFTVMILIMSVMFGAVSIVVYATHTNWKEKSVALAKEVEDREGILTEVRKSLDIQKERLEREQAARRFSLAAMQIRADEYKTRQEEAEGNLRDKQAQNDKLTESLNIAEKTKAALTDEVAKLRVEIRDTQKAADDFFAQVLVLTDGNTQLEGERRRFKEKNLQLIAQVSRLSSVLKSNGLDEFSNLTLVTPDVDGIVTAVAKDMLQISLGFDDGLREGHELDVFRGANFLGRIVIRKITPSSAVGEILPKYRRGEIRKGDRVGKDVG
ncbi:MAG: hypothetical protein QGH11_02685, partial [Pirellulaceae bacterium]|nr:hypothetical protein [Pirellulaceae bacterium]